jgi:hypothetical protein
MKNFIRYNRCFFISSFLLICTIINLCYYFDPYSIYGHVYTKNGQTVNGHEFASQLRMSKVAAVTKQHPEILLMGSSRVALGFSAQSAQAYFPNQRIYNLGLLGITSYELLRYFQHANAVSSLKQVIIGLDLLQFNANQPARPDFVEQRLAVNANNEPNKESYKGDYLPTLFSINAAVSTFKEMTGLAKPNDLYYSNGFRVEPLNGGGVSYFIINETSYINGVYSNFAFRNADSSMDTLMCFKQLLELAQQHKIQLHLFIPPAHARQWEAIHGAGLWQTWEVWKRQLVALNESVAQQYHSQPFELIDFSGYSRYSTESVPREAGKSMRWYADSAHFLPEIGELILQRLFNPHAKAEANFGVALTSATVEQNLTTIRADRVRYIATHPLDKADVDKIVQERARRVKYLFGQPQK